MTLLAALMGALGLTCMIFRKSVLGFLIGTQILAFGATLSFVLSSALSGAKMEGYTFAFLVILSGIGQLVIGYALAVRLFYLKNRASLEDLKNLKH